SPTRRPSSRAPGSIASRQPDAVTVPSQPTSTPKTPEITSSLNEPAEEHDQSSRYGHCGGALRAPPSIGSAASSTKWPCPGGPWLVLRASPGSHCATTSAPPSAIAARAASGGHAG